MQPPSQQQQASHGGAGTHNFGTTGNPSQAQSTHQNNHMIMGPSSSGIGMDHQMHGGGAQTAIG